MPSFPWLPIGFDLGDGMRVGRLVRDGPGYQIVRSNDGQRIAILLTCNGLPAKHLANEKVERIREISFGDQRYLSATFSSDEEPVRVADMPRRPYALSGAEAKSLADALLRMANASANASWGEALFLPGPGICLPTANESKEEDLRVLSVRLLTGGIADPDLSVRQIRSFNPWLTTDEIVNFLEAVAGRPKELEHSKVREKGTSPVEFAIPGRATLEAFFKEYVIDFHRLKDRYDAMGVRPPNGILLYGPPGSGKTFAVRRLAESLGWPVFEIDMGGLGSPYVHQTSVRIRKIFSDAAAKAPSIIVMDEIDAIAGSREGLSQDHKIEEISELLKMIEGAAQQSILVIGTTNRRDAIDPAFLRKGRFDHAIEVGYAEQCEVKAALEALLEERPHVAALNIEQLSQQLAARPMSDVAWVVNESARIAVKSGKDAIDDICLFRAVNQLTERDRKSV